ncbi:unnamed protein product [Strongylus vulgaris]|uniref:Uncharacterized protein n=1 Tax=Strongylus vulgaris TaxID=40348 RepID=A0A3P7JUL1_STRVU|nr:unnamed protein product [Strongylus vulgaris]
MHDLQPKEYFQDDKGWIGSFRMRAKRYAGSHETSNGVRKRMEVKPIAQNNYNLLQGPRMSPLALLAKKLVHTVRTFKSKNKDYKKWQDVVNELKEEGKKLKQKRKVKKLLEQRFDLFKRTLRDEGMGKTLLRVASVVTLH